MKTFFIAMVAMVCIGMTLPTAGANASREDLWKAVDEAMKKGLPQTAITNLQKIIPAAREEKAYPEMVKAIATRIALEGNIQGNKPEERITRMEAEMAKAPEEARPVLQVLLADWYWHYFQQNRWRFMQRTATAEAPGKDFTTWDLKRLFAEIDKHFQAALADASIRKVPVAEWDGLLEKGTMPESYRPTLYDFVAHEALDFYTSGEQVAARPEGAFDLKTDSPIFEGPEEFVKWTPWKDSTDTNSAALKAIRLFQDLLRFHAGDPDPKPAYAHSDLERLIWGFETAAGDGKEERYKKALEGFVERNADEAIAAMAIERHARVLQTQGQLVAARALAQRGVQAYPDSPGAKQCQNLITEIEAKNLNITTERIWNAPWPKITARYKNIERVYFRAIPYEWEKALSKGRWGRVGQLDDNERKELIKMEPALSWDVALPPTTDYKERVSVSTAPGNLKKGYYFILASGDAAFSEAGNIVFACDVWVSDVALVTRTREGEVEGFVVEANSGEPIAGATVQPWKRGQDGKRVREADVRTDENGAFSVKPSGNYNQWLFRASHNGDVVATSDDMYAYERAKPGPYHERVLFFTDRSIYRPGQTVQYKGLSLTVDTEKDNYSLNTNRTVTVIFQDPNGKEIEKRTQKPNAYGSFSGSFTAPRDRLMGQMTIRSESNDGAISIRVEEYKRPKFEVTLDPPTEAPRLNGKVVMSGRALAYTGAAIDGAQITYRVVRRVQMPWWWGWWRGGGYSQNDQEISNGKLTTKTDGSFQLEFEAKPDISISETNEPTFVFSANVDVTDGAGETRSANQSVRVGYTALEARMSVAPWLVTDQPVEVRVTTTTLDGKPQVAEGNIKVHRLQSPAAVQRSIIGGNDANLDGVPDDDMSSVDKWPLGEVITEQGFTTDTNGVGKISVKLPAGAFRAVLETRDRFGKVVTGMLPLQVLEPDAQKFGVKIPFLVAAPRWELQPGDEFMALWGTGYEEGRAMIEIEHRGKIIQRDWTVPGKTQQQVKLAVTEAMRGGFTLHVLQVRENRILHQTMNVSVPWKNKDLEMRWEHFVSKLQPGKEETWTAVISKPQVNSTNEPAFNPQLAEMVATLYDESLDAFMGHNWRGNLNVFRYESSSLNYQFANGPEGFNHILGNWSTPHQVVEIRYRSFPRELQERLWNYAWFGGGRGGAMAVRRMAAGRYEAVDTLAAPAAATAAAELYDSDAPASLGVVANGGTMAFYAKKAKEEPVTRDRFAGVPGSPNEDGSGTSVGEVQARKNLNETAFFFPHLTADSNGVVRMTFTMPEALTRWKFMGVAHDPSLRNGYLEEHAVTSKDLMVQPNPPRFLREGDQIEFSVKVSNQSDAVQKGTVRLTFSLAATGTNADRLLGNNQTDQAFMIPAKESRSFSWKIQVPDGCGFLSYKALASTATVSDGEEAAVPVLSRRVFVTESLPLPIRGPATKNFTFEKLVASGKSKTLENEGYTVQMVSNPAWYAVMALPYLMEYPHECSEQVFNRLYANSLARDIANRDPKIRRIFDLWKNTPALDSPLEKNQDLKSVMLEETPWVRQALAESGGRRNVGILFDGNRLDSEMVRVQQKLREMQIGNGQWPWFPGGPGDDYITLYIVTGFGRLRHLGVDVDVQMAVRALQSLDQWMSEEYERIMRSPDPELYVPSPRVALYLYGRSFFLKDRPLNANFDKPLQFFLTRSREHWLKTGNRQSQGHLALALQRFAKQAGKEEPTCKAITASLRERSVTNEEMGTFWRDLELSWWWFHAPIETQALMIEVFDEIDGDAKMVEDCKVWLLKQKQTQDWKTTKATADAVYALLLRGRDLLASDALVQVRVGDIQITPKMAGAVPLSAGKGDRFSPVVEPGTGFYEVRFSGKEITPSLGKITVKKTDQGVAWGSAHWQYFEDISKVTPHEGTPLKLNKSLYIKKNTTSGPVLEAVKGPVAVGDELVVRIELRTDRDMEYVHMKDQRGSGTEPVNVLSRYKYQDGLGYYESTRDTASHFFISYLPKGTYVFEYSTRVQLRGAYQTGIAEIQCMYAPEFNSHSQSIPLSVK